LSQINAIEPLFLIVSLEGTTLVSLRRSFATELNWDIMEPVALAGENKAVLTFPVPPSLSERERVFSFHQSSLLNKSAAEFQDP